MRNLKGHKTEEKGKHESINVSKYQCKGFDPLPLGRFLLLSSVLFLVATFSVIILGLLKDAFASTVQLPKTGQTKCYDASGTEITCAGTGQDGEIQAGEAWPNPRFANPDGTTPVSANIILDKLTGLEWTKDAGTPAYTGSTSTCTGGTKTWQTALDYVACLNANSYLGFTDWRLPNINELESLVNAQEPNPATWLNGQGFMNVQPDIYCSSSTYAIYSDYTSYIYMYNGYVGYYFKGLNYYVWPVRSGSSSGLLLLPKTGQTIKYATGDDSDLQKGAAWPNPRFTDNSDETVTDNLTGLIWTKNANAPGPSACGPGTYKTWQAALDYIKCLNTNNYLGHNDWRFSNRKELYSMVDHSKYNPAIPAGHPFANVQPINYWSSSVFAGNAGPFSWYVNIFDGYVGSSTKGSVHYVWPVRGGQSGPLNNLSLSVAKTGSGTGTVTASTGTISWTNSIGTASYTSGTQITLTASANTGSSFISWSGCDSTNSNTCNVTMSAAKSVSATFNETVSPVTAAYPAGGTYTASKTVTLIADEAATIYYTTDGSTPTTSSSVYSTPISITSTTILKFFAKDSSGNSESVKTETYTITVSSTDTTPPATSASPQGGPYSSAQTVTLTCTDAGDCFRTFYTSDGSTPSITSTVYSSPIEIPKTTVLKFFSMDSSGNTESVKTQTYLITSTVADTTAPTVSFTSPVSGANVNKLYSISGTASDAASSVSKVELQITDGTYYVDSDSYFVAADTWITTVGTFNWSFNTSRVNWADGTTYTVKVRATDSASNTSDETITTFTKSAYTAPAMTTLSLEVSAQTLLNNGTLDASGKLTRNPDTGASLKDLTVKVTITAPDDSVTTQTATTSDSAGHYTITGIALFSQDGIYTIQATFEATENLYPSNSSTKSVIVGTVAGYAIIVQGKISNGEGQASHNKTANRVYAKLKARGFSDDDIYYFNYDNSQSNVDKTPTKALIQSAITTWAQDKMNISPAPLYIVFINHGSKEKFHINKEVITSTDLDGWLDTLESGLNEAAQNENKVIIIGSSNSGSFIPKLSKSGRVIITSASADEASYKGPMENDNVRSGEFFLEEFFNSLGKGESLGDAFDLANEKTKIFTKKNNGPVADTSNSSNNKYGDNSAQHALLDDSGDAKGSNMLSDDGDGATAKDLYLGAGDVNDVTSVEVTEATETLYLDSTTTTATLWAETSDNDRTDIVLMEVRVPSKKLVTKTTSIQADIDLPRKFMVSNEGTWEYEYTQFTEPGKYEVYYYARDIETGGLSPMKSSIVYKDKDGNSPPSPFGAVSPEDGATGNTVLALDWDDSVDPDGGPVTYTVQISQDSDFSTLDYLKEGIPYSATIIDQGAGLADLTPYYWRVLAIDAYGTVRYSDEITRARIFNTNNTNGLAGIIYGYVADTDTGAPVSQATVSSDTAGDTITMPNGFYYLTMPSGAVTLTVSANGYTGRTVDMEDVPAGGEVRRNIQLQANASNAPSEYNLTVSMSGTGSGSVKASEGASCGTDCYTYTANSTKPAAPRLIAIADAGSKFMGWSGDCTGITTTCTVSMKDNRTVTAIFGKPVIATSADSLSFGEVTKGKTGTSDLTITNSGDVKLLLKSLRFSGTGARMFKVRNKKTKKPVSKTTIAAGDSLELEVIFTASARGAKTATLRIMSDDAATPTKDVMLSGTGK